MEALSTDILKGLSEYDGHEEIWTIQEPSLGVYGHIAIHKRRGAHPSLGATRLWRYQNRTESLRDALRLSRLMSYKSAFAGLPYGGAKAVLTADDSVDRKKLFAWYAGVVNDLGGRFVTGSDVGVSPEEVSIMRAKSMHIIGHEVPAEYYTALGVVKSMSSVLEFLYGPGDLEGRTFAVQGLGKTGWELVRLLHPFAGWIAVADIDPRKTAEAKAEFPKVTVVAPEEVHRQIVDIFAPCALYHSVNSGTAPELACKAIVGSANNQLESDVLISDLSTRGIVYVPDYIANGGGLISVADQHAHGTHDNMRILARLDIVQAKLRRLLRGSRNDAPLAVSADLETAATIL